LEHFVNILFVSRQTALFREFKLAFKSVGTNLIQVEDEAEAKRVLEKKTIGIQILDCSQGEFCSAPAVSGLIRNSKNAEVFTLLMADAPQALAPLVFSVKEGICDILPLPFDPVSLNVKIEVYKRMFFDVQRVTSLMANVFPETVIEDFRRNGKVEPKRYKNAVILFTDFVGFSSKSADLQPMELIRQLEKYFSRFDDICERYRLEKIKTVGDAYMAIAGVTEDLPSPEIRACLAANEIISFVETEFALEKAQGKDGWQIRIGINAGSLVGGIVGRKKLIYDVWGDAVNIAARAEQTSSEGKILITQRIYDKVAPYFSTTFFDEVEIKKRGGRLNMYFLSWLKPEFCNDNWGISPNLQVMDECGLPAMDFYRMRRNILQMLKCFLPDTMCYHTIDHTLKMDETVKRYARLEALSQREILLLRTAALYHDVGFIVEYENNEQFAVMLAKNNLPQYGYSSEDIEKVCELIWATARFETPKNLLEQLMCDADSDYLGRSDYHLIADKLRKELALYLLRMTDEQWLDYQIDYLEYKHRYYSDLVKNIREKGKSLRIEELKEKRLWLIDSEASGQQ